jgi:hypothetical protein
VPLAASLDDALAGAAIVVIGNRDAAFANIAARLRGDQTLVDLTGRA